MLFLKRFLIVLFLLISSNTFAAYIKFMPTEVLLPDKTTLSCFVTGDEFNKILHDKDGYTIVQSDTDGYFYYAQKQDGKLVPSSLRAGVSNPKELGVEPFLNISVQQHNELISEFQASTTQRVGRQKAVAISTGILTNIVIYVRFKDEPEYTKSRKDFNKIFESASNVASLKNYYEEISYGKFSIKSEQFPICDSTITLSYQDTQLRSYFQPYNAVTNTNGYTPESPDREQALVKRAIDAVSSQIPANVVVDANGDNYVDNVTIVIKGAADGWGKLLWPHRWSLYKTAAYIQSKRINDYIFIPESNMNVKTMCHEMFHVVGAPDLYHYTDNDIDPAGGWDLMQSGGGHPTAYMKWKYADKAWINDIPEITQSGEYTLNPLTSPTNNCFKIKSPYSSSEYFVVEYRRKSGLYENNLPQSGMIVSRINSLASGNGGGPPDEVYIMRPQGTLFSNGSINSAALGNVNGRPDFNYNTNPRSLLTDQTDAGVSISNIRITNDNVIFDVDIKESLMNKNNWLVTADNYEKTGSYAPINIKDDNSKSMWHSGWTSGTTPFPHWLSIDFGQQISINGIKYTPRQDMENGRIKDYELYASQNGVNWNLISTGTFPNSKLEQTISFPEQYCKHFKLLGKNEVSGRSVATIAELSPILNNSLMSRKNWTLLNASSFNVGFEPALAFDSVASTMWHSKYTAPVATYPHEIAIDMNAICSIDGLFYLPRQDASTNGTIAKYEFYTSLDGANWQLVSEGTWGNNKAEKIARFNKSVCRYIKLVALSEINSGNHASVSELAVFGTVTNDITAPSVPLNFKVVSHIANDLKLTWDIDQTDQSILYYNVYSSDLLIAKKYTNDCTLSVESNQNYTLALQAVDGSGNVSAKQTLIYNTTTDVNNPASQETQVISISNKIRISNIRNGSLVRIYNSMGQLLFQKFASGNEIEFNHKFSGVGIVEIVSGNSNLKQQKIIFK